MSKLGALPGVETITPISRPFKLTSREFRPEDTVIRVLDASVGDGGLTIMAGPCSVESRDQLFETADAVKAAGASILRGGAVKPRTSPYAFQGLKEAGLKHLALARKHSGLPVVTEVLDPIQVLPAPGQGALAVECRADRDDVIAAVQARADRNIERFGLLIDGPDARPSHQNAGRDDPRR